MTEQTQGEIKVYELAKELGIDSFTLLDKLKEIDINVKSHMSSLAAEQTQAIRSFLAKKTEKAPKTVTRTRAAAKPAAAKETAVAKEAAAAPAAEAPAKRKVTRAAAAKPAAAKETAAAKEAAPAAGAPQKRIIKRRTTADGEVVRTDNAPPTPAMEASPETATGTEMGEEAAQNTMGSRANLRAGGSQRAVEQDEMMDEFRARRLKIVQQAPPPGTVKQEVAYRTPGGPAGGAARKPGMPAAARPQGPQAPTEMFNPITSIVGKDDEGRKRGAGAAKPVEDIKISDFRRREIVFQPKKKRLPPGKMVKQTMITTPGATKRKIRIEDKIVVSEFAQRMGEKAATIIAKLMNLGVTATINQTIDFDTAALIAGEFDFEIENIAFKEETVLKQETDESGLKARPPVITVMGHVDHGKTSLLDAIRNAKVAEGEAGGITQHIGAYSVNVDGKILTFLDTPGHEAFANMRARGANMTDIVVLVVAADDSIMPQTKEAILHAQNAKVPMIVAANKMDKPDANLERLKKDLSAHNVLVEEWGGEVPMVPISALKKTGLKELLETISVQAEVLDLKANPDLQAEGAVLEARMEKGRGVVTDLLIRRGTLRAGDAIVVGTTYGRVRSMTNDRGESVKEVKPGYPVEIIGLTDVASAGDTFYVTKSEADAKSVAENRRAKILEQKAIDLAPKAMTLDELMAKIPVAGLKELNLLIKTDVYGSAEAIRESVMKIDSEKVKPKIIQCSVGVITENDVLMAKTSNAKIFGFNVKPDSKAREMAKRENVEIKHHTIIYEMFDEIRTAMEDLLEPLKVENYIGKAEVKQAFSVSKIGTIAGSTVVDGKVQRNAVGRVTRGKKILHEGKIISLKRFKDDASETIKGQECGIGIQNFTDYQAGDVIEVFHVEYQKQKL